MTTLGFPGPFPRPGRRLRPWAIGAVLLFIVRPASFAQQDAAGAVHPPKPAPSATYALLRRDVIESRLRAAPRRNEDREAALDSLFIQAGCRDADLSEEPVKHEKFPNLICRMPGRLESTIIVGAHFDKVARGGGVVDNWSGASLLPSLFQSLHDRPRKHTFIFVGFTAEEQGLVGSRYYVSQMTPDEVARTRAMVNIDTLALGPTNIWLTHSDRRLASAFYGVAQSMKLPVAIMNADRVGNDDSASFMRRKIPTLMIHSITNPTLHILHSADDNFSAVKFGDYYDSYRLLSAYLAWLDAMLDQPE
jgi:hypothetical protein